jgi:hypothetical protein
MLNLFAQMLKQKKRCHGRYRTIAQVLPELF